MYRPFSLYLVILAELLGKLKAYLLYSQVCFLGPTSVVLAGFELTADQY